jgi:hypothetical protein
MKVYSDLAFGGQIVDRLVPSKGLCHFLVVGVFAVNQSWSVVVTRAQQFPECELM